MDFFSEEALTAPAVTPEEARRIARDAFAMEAEATPLGSQQDANFLLRGPQGTALGVLKIANPAFTAVEIQAQSAGVEHIARRAQGLRLPMSGPCVEVDTADGRARARVLTFLPGGTLTGSRYLAPDVVTALGDVAGRVSAALADFTHPGLERVLQWDPQHADRVVELLADHVPDEGRRDLLVRSAREAWRDLSRVADDLPRQAVHLDITDDNVVCRAEAGRLVPDGVIDFGDLTMSWAVGELAITISSVLHHAGAEPSSVAPAVKAFDRWHPLTDAEIEALWPLVVLRAAVLVVSGVHQAGIDADNDYLTASLDREWLIFERAISIPSGVMTGVLRAALGRPVKRPAAVTGSLLTPYLDPRTLRVLDLSTLSDDLDAGVWLNPATEDRLARKALDDGPAAVFTRFGEPRLTRSALLADRSPATIATGIDVWFAHPTTLAAPPAHHLLTAEWDGGEPVPIEAPTEVPAGRRVRLTLRPESGPELPAFVRPEYAPGWLAFAIDPTPLLGADATRENLPAEQGDSRLLARREGSLASVQEHYYRDPPRIERGWRHHLAATDGRVYLDMVNNVAAVGHAHPHIADAASRQLRRLNTNSRFNYSAVVDFGERLASLLPDPLDTVFFVNSGSEAVDLALRLAFAATGRQDVVAVREAYHGWTFASDAVSTSIADNPNALTTRPDWVHTVDAPNSYRGVHRGAESARYAAVAARAIDDLAARGRPAAAFIAEAFYGNAGGMPLPDGYLEQVYAAVRSHGGLAIADEIQVGYGRLGRWFWGFEQQGVVPDIVTVAKAMGNGHPLGAVVTSREVAERYRTGGYFFSSTGGSPVSSVIGSAVLDVIEAEKLQLNARTVGAHLKARLAALADRHDLIGAVYGEGLYLGVEFVRSRDTLEPATEETWAICDRMLELGVIIQPTSDRLCVLKIKPPLCIDLASADYFVDTLDRVLTEGW